MRLGPLAVLAALVTIGTAAHAAVKVSIDINDPRAPRGTVRSFSGNGLTLGGLKSKVGALKPGQAVAMWCKGPGMGADGTSAFDVIVAGEFSTDVRKLNVKESTRLEDVCEADAKAFRSRR